MLLFLSGSRICFSYKIDTHAVLELEFAPVFFRNFLGLFLLLLSGTEWTLDKDTAHFFFKWNVETKSLRHECGSCYMFVRRFVKVQFSVPPRVIVSMYLGNHRQSVRSSKTKATVMSLVKGKHWVDCSRASQTCARTNCLRGRCSWNDHPRLGGVEVGRRTSRWVSRKQFRVFWHKKSRCMSHAGEEQTDRQQIILKTWTVWSCDIFFVGGTFIVIEIISDLININYLIQTGMFWDDHGTDLKVEDLIMISRVSFCQWHDHFGNMSVSNVINNTAQMERAHTFHFLNIVWNCTCRPCFLSKLIPTVFHNII